MLLPLSMKTKAIALWALPTRAVRGGFSASPATTSHEIIVLKDNFSYNICKLWSLQ